MTCMSREYRRRMLMDLRVTRTYPKTLETHVRLRMEGKRNAERQRQDVVRDEVEQRTEVLTACPRCGQSRAGVAQLLDTHLGHEGHHHKTPRDRRRSGTKVSVAFVVPRVDAPGMTPRGA